MKTKILVAALLLASSIVVGQNVEVQNCIHALIEDKYKNYAILEIEENDNLIEVEIIHKSKKKDVIFDNNGVWQSTKYEIKEKELPASIIQAIDNSDYSYNSIDDIEVIETPKRLIYEIELNKWFGDDVIIYVDSNGVIL